MVILNDKMVRLDEEIEKRKKSERDSNKEFSEQLKKDIEKYGKIENGSMYIDSGLQKQKIGNIQEINERINSYFDKSDLAEQIWEVQPYFYDSAKLWWLWDNIQKRWKEVDETDILNIVSAKSSANTVHSKEKGEIVEAMKQYGRKKKPKIPEKTWIQFKDAIYDLETDKNFNATPEYFICNPIPWDIGESEETPEIDKLFEEWVGKDYVKTLKQICAYCMLPDYPIHRLFCLIGEGSNGKSKFLELVIKLVGNENITSTELEDLIGVRFEKAKLYTKSVCIMGETNFSNLRKTSLIKKLTGQDPIGGEKKNKNPFDFINYAKLLISTNGLPYTEDKSDGFFRRWCIINFPNKFKEKNDILSRIPEHEYNNFCKASISLLKELLQDMEFFNEGSVEERKMKYNEFSNPVSKFIESECVVGDGYKIPFFKFFEELTFFIKNNGYRELSKVEVSKILDREGYNIKTQRFEKDQNKSSSWKMIMGIELNYGGTERYLVEKDLSLLSIPEELKSKNVGEIVVYRRENKEILEILEKEGYVKYLGK